MVTAVFAWMLLMGVGQTELTTAPAVESEPGVGEIEMTVGPDEELVFFPTYGYRDDDGWTINLHGWIYEMEADSPVRRLLLAALREALDVEDYAPGLRTFNERAALFLVDSERDEVVSIRVGEKVYTLLESGADGHIRDRVHISDRRAKRLLKRQESPDRWLRYQAAGLPEDSPSIEGQVLLIDPVGVSVISDIDDTIRRSNVGDIKKLLIGTFMMPFEPVAGMAELYQRWAEQGAVFHYVSESPWQLHRLLRDFLADHGFPKGTMHLRVVRLSPFDLEDLLADDDEEKAKTSRIERILRDFPKRRFILVGDDTQHDPEIYGRFARQYGDRIAKIYIRQVIEDDAGSSRMKAAFEDVPSGKIEFFTAPDQIKPLEWRSPTGPEGS